MTPYQSASGKKSGVNAYEIGKQFIIIQFRSDRYKYSYASCGEEDTEKMKGLALAGKGLSTFISQEDPSYEWKR